MEGERRCDGVLSVGNMLWLVNPGTVNKKKGLGLLAGASQDDGLLFVLMSVEKRTHPTTHIHITACPRECHVKENSYLEKCINPVSIAMLCLAMG